MRDQESEKNLEARLVTEIKKRGGIAVKNTSQFHRGLPDRLVLLPFHTLSFVEMKSTGRSLTPLQQTVQSKLWNLGYTVYVIDSTEALEGFLAKMDRRINKCKAQEESLLADLNDEAYGEER